VEYEHPLDRVALENLKKIPLMPKLIEYVRAPLDSISRLKHAGSYLRINEKQMPSVHKLMKEACEILHIGVICSNHARALLAYMQRTSVMCYSGQLNLLNDLPSPYYWKICDYFNLRAILHKQERLSHPMDKWFFEKCGG